MYKQLMMTRVSLTGLWTDIYNRSNTEGRDVDTVDKAKAIIDIVYAEELGSYTYETTDTEIYVISENLISPCVNCPS
jgi:hypothetical protein